MKMIRVPDDELERNLHIAIAMAPRSALPTLFDRRRVDTRIAEQALLQKVLSVLRSYTIERPAQEHELAPEMTPLIPLTKEDLERYSRRRWEELEDKRRAEAERARIRRL